MTDVTVNVEYKLRDSGIWVPYNARAGHLCRKHMEDHYRYLIEFNKKMTRLLVIPENEVQKS